MRRWERRSRPSPPRHRHIRRVRRHQHASGSLLPLLPSATELVSGDVTWPLEDGGSFAPMKVLGRGGASACCVWLCRAGGASTPLKRVAVKVFRPGGRFERQAVRESKILAHAGRCERIIRFLTLRKVESLSCLVMESCSHTLGQLARIVGGFGSFPHLLVDIWKQVASGICALHRKGYCHGDIKPSNIGYVADRAIFKLLDFGLSFSLKKGPIYRVASDAYRSPGAHIWSLFCGHADEDECRAIRELFSPEAWKFSDVWAFGVLAVEIGRQKNAPLPPPPSKQISLLMEIPRNEMKSKLINIVKHGNLTNDEKVLLSLKLSMKRWVERIFSPSNPPRNTSEASFEACNFVTIFVKIFQFDLNKRPTLTEVLDDISKLETKSFKEGIQQRVLNPWPIPSRAMALMNALNGKENPEELQIVLGDVRDRCESLYGQVDYIGTYAIHHSLPSRTRIIVTKFTDTESCIKAVASLSRSTFDGRSLFAFHIDSRTKAFPMHKP